MSVPPSGDGRVLITAEGYEEHCRELDRLRDDERRKLRALVREARGDGALHDNPALAELLREHAQLERRIAVLEAQLAVAGRAAIGSTVRVRDAATGDVFEYQLVGPVEGDPTSGRLSIAAPVGRALIGQRAGAQVEIATPRGAVTLEVIEVAPSAPASEAA